MKFVAADSPPKVRVTRDSDSPQESPSEAAVLSNGQYSVRFSEVGSGTSELGGVAITRSAGDETRDADGFYIYLRDLDDGLVWSAGYQPTRVRPARYTLRHDLNRVELTRLDHEIDCHLTVTVAPRNNFENRNCRLTNLGTRVRRIELTSYLEWVLGTQDADRSHPAFSKLFVETQFCAERSAILARRRPRNSDESEFWGFHSLLRAGKPVPAGELQFETNRVRFIGRGRTLRRPIALEPGMILTGDSGPVLDPIGSLRLAVRLEPGESQEISFVLGAAQHLDDIHELLIAEGTTTSSVVPRPKGMTLDFANGRPTSSFTPTFVESWIEEKHQRAVSIEAKVEGDAAKVTAAQKSPLQFDNGYGGFSADGREYVIRLQPDGRGGHHRPPMPWTNVIANQQAGFLVTESGASYTWSGNSRTNRLTAWHNDPVCDPHAEALWIRDEDRGEFWSPTPGPTPTSSEYEVQHGFGYTVFKHESHGLSQEVTTFMTRDEPLKLTRVRIVNHGGQTRRLSLYSYLQWALGGLTGDSAGAIETRYGDDLQAIWATNSKRELYGQSVAFSAMALDYAGHCKTSYTCDRAAFVGRYGDIDSPAAIAGSETLDCHDGSGLDPCAAWQVQFELTSGDAFECTFLLGESVDQETATSLVHKYADAAQVRQALADVRQFWLHLLSAVTIETPDREIDLLVNGWLTYQNLSCRMWGRSAYYQPGGAFGFRDQLQDSAALLHHNPDITRAQILRHAAHQFVEGDVLHWWHPDTGYGLRTRFSDDLLWLPCIAAEYVASTGDAAVLDEQVQFVTAPPLNDGQQEAYLRPASAGVSASLYEHCCRALDRGLTCGAHGLPLIGCGDWNDGFSRVGQQGKGESVWLGFFIEYTLQRMLPICSSRGDDARVARYSDYRTQLVAALNSAGWDGSWYRRAFYDNGKPIGSSQSDECQIDAIAQAWSVISGAAPSDRAAMAIQSANDRLVCEDVGMIRLLAPPFDQTPNDPGYIKGYLPGIRENGGQYTHGVLWLVRALAEMGRGTRAVELLRMLSPIWHTNTHERVHVYQTEPYVVAADVYGEPPHVGRGGWTWYTGSAGWMFRVAIESIFGISIEGGRTLVVNPSIAADWPSCRLMYRLPDGATRYDICIENPAGKEQGVSAALLDERPTIVANGIACIPLANDGLLHRVVIRL
jgi:N,N'-diacetylchitobiose phosphorylase